MHNRCTIHAHFMHTWLAQANVGFRVPPLRRACDPSLFAAAIAPSRFRDLNRNGWPDGAGKWQNRWRANTSGGAGRFLDNGGRAMMVSVFRFVAAPGLVVSVLLGSPAASVAEPISTDAVSEIYGLAFDPGSATQGRARLYLATQYGLLGATPDGLSTVTPDLEVGVSTLAVQPENPRQLYASGFGVGGTPLGLLSSPDGGASWSVTSDPASEPMAFRAISFSAAEPTVAYAIAEDLEVSRDGGKTWSRSGKLPETSFSVAASALDAATLYAGTMAGLMQSRDGGANWLQVFGEANPVTMVHAVPDNGLYAFVYGIGLIFAQEPELDWQVVSSDFADRFMMNLTFDPVNPTHLFATFDTGAIMTSANSGKSWSSFEGSDTATPENIAKGQQLFEATCQVCHGVKGIGEVPDDPEAADEFGFKAPALNNDAHAWHHSDQNLTAFILDGSPRNLRMVAFKTTLSDTDVADIVAYIKSLWSFRSLACQGARHMSCMAAQ